ncbi:MAG: hypothetical protein ABGW69_00520 [Nanoarchaeota archaeon]
MTNEEYIYENAEGIQLDTSVLDKLIEPDYKNIDPTNPLISRDTILANFDENDLELLLLYSDLTEIATLNREQSLTFTEFLNSLNRRAKILTIMTRGKYGFQNKLLKTNINISRSGIEEMPNTQERMKRIF